MGKSKPRLPPPPFHSVSTCHLTTHPDGLRIGHDLMHLYFVFDEHSDLSAALETRNQASAIMSALRNPSKPRPPNEFIGGRVAQSFWLNALRSTPSHPLFHQRFIASFQRYVDAVVQQSQDRDQGFQRDLQSYLGLRRFTIGAEPSFALNAIEMDFPDEIIEHPTIKRLEGLTTDMIIVWNDIVSFDRE